MTTVAIYARYGQWLSFLMRKNPEVLGVTPIERITQSRVEAYIAEFKPVSRRGL